MAENNLKTALFSLFLRQYWGKITYEERNN
jgi:hypothetical protein